MSRFVPIVNVDNIRHLYGSHVALDGISFEVPAGECFGLLGPNGSGKSTLFKILTTLLPPSSGSAFVAGHNVVTQRSDVRSRIGVVFQSPSLDIHLTVRENLVHGGRLYGLSSEDLRRRVSAVTQALNIDDRANALVKTLSGGLKRRVELAKCMLHEPALLILDEPCNGLDPVARVEFWQYLTRYGNRGVTLLLTTHDMDEADQCDRLALFDRGKLVALGMPDELKQRVSADCITIVADDAALVAGELEANFKMTVRVIDGVIRAESREAATIMPQLFARFGSRIRSITLSKPTLGDVFMHETGHRFANHADKNVEEQR
ncbi:MAG: ATP-binding cassette domain-containing protein [Planctomycetes bacterium]|nr:ATP-binding cassette domain-containing protein [Planctomycetota bacterium]